MKILDLIQNTFSGFNSQRSAGQPHLHPEKVMEQLDLETKSRHMKNKKMIRRSQQVFTKVKSRLTNLIAFYNEKAGLVNE